MLDVEERICQKLAKQFGLEVAQIKKIHRSQYRQIAKTFRAKEGAAFALPYIGEFSILPKYEYRFVENKNKVEC